MQKARMQLPRRKSLDDKLAKRLPTLKRRALPLCIVVVVLYFLYARSDDTSAVGTLQSKATVISPPANARGKWLRARDGASGSARQKRAAARSAEDAVTEPPYVEVEQKPPPLAPPPLPQAQQPLSPPPRPKLILEEKKPPPPYAGEHKGVSLSTFLNDNLGPPSSVKPYGRAVWVSMGDALFSREFLSHAQIYLESLPPRPGFPKHEMVVFCLDEACINDGRKRGMLPYGGFLHDEERPKWVRTDTWAKAVGASASLSS